MSITLTLLARVEQFCRDQGMSERHFGLAVAGNHKFVSRLRDGHGINTATYERTVAFIEGRDVPPRVTKRRAPCATQVAA